MCFIIKSIYDVHDIKSEWSKVVKATSYAWFWSEYYEHCFRLITLEKKRVLVKDKSFFIYDKQKNLCGLVPLVFIESNNYKGIEACYDKPLPWPMIMEHAKNNTLIVEFIFSKIDELLNNDNVKKISWQYSPPDCDNNFSKIFTEAMREYRYIENSYMAHYVSISSETLDRIRKRYKRYVKKYINAYSLSIIDRANIDMDIVKEYMELHIKDSGAFHRPLETYIAQFDFVVQDDGFIVQANDNKTGNIVGMLLISVNKKAAYDGSVAVDPNHQQYYVSHLMKWQAIQYLIDI